MDLLEYAQKLVSRGNNNQEQNDQLLQSLTKQDSLSVKSDNKQPGHNTLLLVGGLVILGISVLGIGY